MLIGKELWEYSFLKSVEEVESKGLNFSRLVRKSEKSDGAEMGNVRARRLSEWG